MSKEVEPVIPGVLESPSNSIKDLLSKQAEGDEEEVQPIEYPLVAFAEWPDEDKPKFEERFRRKCPIHHESCCWVLLGNDETWLIPELDALGKDVEIEKIKTGGLFGRISLKFTAKYKHHKKLRDLMSKVMLLIKTEEGGDELNIDVPWEDAYAIMYLALQVNYKIPPETITDSGLLREEHFWPMLAALIGLKKKVKHGQGSGVPLPLTT